MEVAFQKKKSERKIFTWEHNQNKTKLKLFVYFFFYSLFFILFSTFPLFMCVCVLFFHYFFLSFKTVFWNLFTFLARKNPRIITKHKIKLIVVFLLFIKHVDGSRSRDFFCCCEFQMNSGKGFFKKKKKIFRFTRLNKKNYIFWF